MPWYLALSSVSVGSSATPKVYIGQTWYKIKTRMATHKRDVRNGAKFKLHNSMRKYGIDTFTISILETCETQIKANELEDFYILQFNSIENGLNLKRGGATGSFSEQSRKKMSKSKMGKKNNRYGIVGKDHPMFGKRHTAAAKKKINESQTGDKHWMYGKSISKKEKIRLAEMSHKMAKLNEQKVREIKILLREGKISLIDIAKMYDITDSNVRSIKKGNTWSQVKIT